MDSAFLKKVDVLKKQTFTNEKIAETLDCSLSTVKRVLHDIHDGGLIPAYRKWGMTGNARFLCQELDELGKVCIARNPKFAESKLYLRNRDVMKEAESLPPFDDSSPGHIEPENETEKRWLRNYRRRKQAYFKPLRGEGT